MKFFAFERVNIKKIETTVAQNNIDILREFCSYRKIFVHVNFINNGSESEAPDFWVQ